MSLQEVFCLSVWSVTKWSFKVRLSHFKCEEKLDLYVSVGDHSPMVIHDESWLLIHVPWHSPGQHLHLLKAEMILFRQETMCHVSCVQYLSPRRISLRGQYSVISYICNICWTAMTLYTSGNKISKSCQLHRNNQLKVTNISCNYLQLATIRCNKLQLATISYNKLQLATISCN